MRVNNWVCSKNPTIHSTQCLQTWVQVLQQGLPMFPPLQRPFFFLPLIVSCSPLSSFTDYTQPTHMASEHKNTINCDLHMIEQMRFYLSTRVWVISCNMTQSRLIHFPASFVTYFFLSQIKSCCNYHIAIVCSPVDGHLGDSFRCEPGHLRAFVLLGQAECEVFPCAQNQGWNEAAWKSRRTLSKTPRIPYVFDWNSFF